MTLEEILGWSGIGLFALLSIIQIAPIVIKGLNEVKAAQKVNTDRLNEHIRQDDERAADEHRAKILRFNNELIRDIPHTKEEFSDILANIDHYERYCKQHPEYKNNRAAHAIANIGRVYDERLAKHDFL